MGLPKYVLIVDDAIERHEVVDESFLSVEIAGVDKSSKSTTVPKPVKSKSRVCLFITDTLMAQRKSETYLKNVPLWNDCLPTPLVRWSFVDWFMP
eukprot:COSAG02_NODE_1950_length_10291_cov_13.985381_1_plen_95_part_00